MMDGSTLINSVDRIDRLHSLIRHDLRDLGIKLPKSKKVKKQNQSRRSISLSSQNSQEGVVGNKIFGQHLSQIPCVSLDHYGYVPQFLISTGEFVINHSDSEGIFRKSGSVGRQKELRVAVEDGKPLEEANIHDVTSLIKQFFRELPEPLIIPIYHDAFIKSFQLPAEKDPKEALLRMCLLLPLENLGALRYTMHLLHRVAQRSEKNRMTCNNLALVIAPNVMGSSAGWKTGQKMTVAEERVLHAQTCIVELLIKHWDQVAVVPAPLKQQLNMMSECFATDDELDVSDDNTLEDGRDSIRKKKRRRSGSLTGIVSSIAQGIAKLRRSTDGKSINMSSNSTFRAELSLAADNSALSQTQDYSVSDVTPYIMRKRPASGDGGPFTSSKKQAILGNLPQRSALVNTPFTPSSTLKREQYPQKGGPSANQKLNATTPIMGTKTSRKKLNLFTSPVSNKKMKRQTSVSGRLESPPAKSGKGKNMFRRKSGSRDKRSYDDSALASESLREAPARKTNTSPKSAVSDSALHEAGRKKEPFRSASSISLQDSSESSLVVVDDETDGSTDSVFYTTEQSSGEGNKSVRFARARSKSADSPGVRPGQPGVVPTGALRVKGRLDKSLISEPSPLVVPVVVGAVDCKDREMRRSRRDEFERQNRRPREHVQREGIRAITTSGQEISHKSDFRLHAPLPPLPLPDPDLDKSVASQLDASLMEAVLPPPHGFGDQTMLEEEVAEPGIDNMGHHKDSPEEEEIDVDSDVQSEAGFSTISGGTVMLRTDSGRYMCQDHHSVSGSSLVSSSSRVKASRPLSMPVSLPKKSSIDSDGPPACVISSKSEQTLSTTCPTDNKPRNEGKPIPQEQLLQEEDPYVVLRADASTSSNAIPEGDYVVLRLRKGKPEVERQSVTESSRGMKLLRENYHSSEEDSSSSGGNLKPDLNVTIGSHQDDLDNMPTQADVTKRKSLSAEDLQTRARQPTPSRAHSLYMSPCRRFNYKPYLEISRETHTILARAGYMEPSAPTDKSKDVQVPVKSPTRSTYREEMRSILRSSFYDHHSRLSASLRSHRNRSSVDASLASVTSSSTANTSITSDCEKLSISSHSEIKSASGDTCSVANESSDSNTLPVSELMLKVAQISADLQVSSNQTTACADKESEEKSNTNTNCLSSSSDNSQQKSPGTKATTERPATTDVGEQKPKSMGTCPHDSLKSLKENDKMLTLSGFLDKEIASQVQIKRAEMLLPKHDSILDVKQAGIVAQSVRHFSQHASRGDPNRSLTSQRRGNQALRIPTIFAKSEESFRHYKEITNFLRERSGADILGQDERPASPQTNDDPEEHLDGDRGSETSETEDGNVTVLEVHGSGSQQKASIDPVQNDGIYNICPSVENGFGSHVSSSPNHRPDLRGHSLTPKKAELPSCEVVKSPLLESTNTAATAANTKPSLDLSEALALCAGSDEVLNSLASRPKSQTRPHTPGGRAYTRNQLKRLKAGSTSRKQALSSPVADVKSSKPGLVLSDNVESEVEEDSKLSAAPVSGDDDLHV